MSSTDDIMDSKKNDVTNVNSKNFNINNKINDNNNNDFVLNNNNKKQKKKDKSNNENKNRNKKNSRTIEDENNVYYDLIMESLKSQDNESGNDVKIISNEKIKNKYKVDEISVYINLLNYI